MFKVFLSALDPWVIFWAALMADAGSEVLLLIRMMDSEELDTTAMCGAINDFFSRITWLFSDRGCLQVSGHVAFIVKWLKDPHYVAIRGVGKCIGGIDVLAGEYAGNIDTCFAHMEAWITLARHTLEAEFPRFDIIHAFAAFEIPRGANARKPMCPAQKRNLERLAEAFGTPNLCVEFLDSWPNAVQAHEGFSCSAWEAWARAIKKAEQVGRACSELKSVAQHGMCFVPSTSGVEQSFSGIAAVLTKARLKSAAHHEQQAVNLLAARLTPAEIETLASEAQSLWKDVFMRHSRQHLHQRCDIGVHRPRKVPKPQVAEDGKKTEKQYIMDLRNEVGHRVSVASSSGSLSEGVATAPVLWNPGHEREKKFQQQKQQQRRVEAHTCLNNFCASASCVLQPSGSHHPISYFLMPFQERFPF